MVITREDLVIGAYRFIKKNMGIKGHTGTIYGSPVPDVVGYVKYMCLPEMRRMLAHANHISGQLASQSLDLQLLQEETNRIFSQEKSRLEKKFAGIESS